MLILCVMFAEVLTNISYMKNRTTAIILAFLLGGFGAHKFYLGESGKGIIFLLFCWTFIPGIIAFIDFIKYLVMSDDEFNQKYNPSINYVHKNALNVSDEIEKLHRLKEKGIITEKEFEDKKKALL